MHKMKEVLSLFCGCGGFDIGFKSAGYEVVAAFDNDALAIKNYNKNIDSVSEIMDLSSVIAKEKIKKYSPSVVLCGAPCQGFSTNGKRKLDDPRNTLLEIGAELAISCSPDLIIFENVPAVASWKHSVYWERVKSMCVAAGFEIEDQVFDMAEFGVPQKRRRRFLFATKNGLSISLNPVAVGPSLLEAISGVEKQRNHDYSYFKKDSRDMIIASSIKMGQKLSNVRVGERYVPTWDIPEVFGKTTKQEKDILRFIQRMRRRNRRRDFGDADPVSLKVIEEFFQAATMKLLDGLIRKGYVRDCGDGYYDLKNTYNGRYHKLDKDSPSVTVDSYFGDPRYFIHPIENRGFSVREAARLQTFPDNYVFEGPLRNQYRMIGNAVPPAFSEALARSINK